ncbi:MAG TPA: TetR/AcrR family transcriptional regulator [Rhizomicrobium sp.]|jgi:AcrR family transcriptional regulator
MAAEKSPRGRPRDPALRKKILAAAAYLLNEGGITSVTMEAVAAKAGVGKPTIYREWPNAQSVAMAAFLETTRPAPQEMKKGKALDALRAQLRAVAQAFATRTGRNTAMMIAAAQNDSELAKVFRNQFIMGRREEGRTLLARAVAARELRADIDFDVTLDLLYAPLYFRLLIGHGLLDAAFTDAVLDQALKGLKARRG